MGFASSHVTETTPPAATLAPKLVTAKPNARHALRLVKWLAVTRNAANCATSHVLPVRSKTVLQDVHIRTAQCHALLRVIGSLALRGVKHVWAVDINVCCSDKIKSTMVDFIMGLQYDEIDIDVDPCIFPACGHFVVKSSMDGVMDMKAHYTMSAEDNPIAVTGSSRAFSMEEVKTCPTCRSSLRNIARYGRIVRRAMLDEATKKFIAWSNDEHLQLAQCLVDIQQGLSEMPLPRILPQKTRAAKLRMTTNVRLKQLHAVCDSIGAERYRSALKLWYSISDYIKKMREEEQPFQRVADFVHHAQAQGQTKQGFVYDETVIQVKGKLQGLSLWLRCESIVFSDFIKVHQNLQGQVHSMNLDFGEHVKESETLIELAKTSKLPRLEVEGHVYHALFCAFARWLAPDKEIPSTGSEGSSHKETFRVRGVEHLSVARELLEKYPSTRMLETDVEAAEAMLRNGTFYTSVSSDEMKAVYQAMAREFRGTGHWYTCENGHPFTVGECGMPMQEARCPECGGPVGGSNHNPAAGVRRAQDIEALAHGVDRIEI